MPIKDSLPAISTTRARYRSLRNVVLFFALVLFLGLSPTIAQTTAPQSAGANTPGLTQSLSWKAVEYASAYELEITDLNGKVVFREKSNKTTIHFSLPAGEYRYQITLYNLLDRPESASPWEKLVIKKAQQPLVQSIFPLAVYLEAPNYRIEIEGENFVANAQVRLLDATTDIEIPGHVPQVQISPEGNRIYLDLDPGTPRGRYRIVLSNPGGLRSVSQDVLTIDYQYPVDFSLSIGYSPAVLLGDQWTNEHWDQSFFAASGKFQIQVMPLKSVAGYLGAQLGIGLTDLSAAIRGQDIPLRIDTSILSVYLGAVYSYPLSTSFAVVLGLGGGVTYAGFELHSMEPDLATITSLDTMFYASLGAQYSFSRQWFMDLSVDYRTILMLNNTIHLLQPGIAIGLRID